MVVKGSNGNSPNQVIILGAGITGLLAARNLQDAGQPVLVLEKESGVGGRMATRCVQEGVFDYGAQFFSAHRSRFQMLVQEWIQEGVVREWARTFPRADRITEPTDQPHYRGHPDMTAVPKYLASDLDIHLNQRVQRITRQAGKWLLQTQNGETFSGGALVLTPPLPQSLALLKTSAVELPKLIENCLNEITYDPCIALLALTEKPSRIPEPGAIQSSGRDIRWISDNYYKGISPQAFGLTIQATPDFSQWYWHASDQTITNLLVQKARRWIDGDLRTAQVMRWRYAQASQVYPDSCLLFPGPPPLVLAGDAFEGSRVESAAMSGLSATDSLLS